jgi:hypothetical protein
MTAATVILAKRFFMPTGIVLTICDLSRSFPVVSGQIMAANAVCPYGMSRRKAAVNRAHSKRFAKFEDAQQSRQHLDCACFSTAFDSMFNVGR